MSLAFDFSDIGNEAEVLNDDGIPEEPEVQTIVIRRKSKTKGKRKADLAVIEMIVESAITIP